MNADGRRLVTLLIAISMLTVMVSIIPLRTSASEPLAFITDPSDGQAGRYYEYVPEFNTEADVIGHWTNAPFLSWTGEGLEGTPDFDQFGRYILSIYIQSKDGMENANQNVTVEFDTYWNKESLDDAFNIERFSVAVGSDGVLHASYANDTGVLKHLSWSDGWSQTFSMEGVTGDDPITFNSIAVDSNNYPHIVYQNSTGLWYVEKNSPTAKVESWDLLTNPIGTTEVIGSVVSLLLDSTDNAHVITARSSNQDGFYMVRSVSSFNQVMTISGLDYWDFALMSNDSPRFVYTTSTDPSSKKVHYGGITDGAMDSEVIFDDPYMLLRPKLELYGDIPHIVFQKNQSSDVSIHYGFHISVDWDFETVAGPDQGVLSNPNLQLDGDGDVSVLFVRTSSPTAVYHSTRDGVVWEHETVESRYLAGYGQFCDFLLGGDGTPHAFYSRGSQVIHAFPSQWAPQFLNSPEDVYVDDYFEYKPLFDEPSTIVANSSNALFLEWDQSGKKYYGTPLEGQNGTYWINLTATAVYGGLSTTINETFVVKPLYAPVLTSDPPFTSHEGQVGEEYRYRIVADDQVEWSWSSDAAFLTEYTNTSWQLSFRSTPSVAGTFNVNISATSLEGLLTSYENFTLTIIPRWAPNITSEPVTNIQETSLYSYTVVVNETEVTWGALQTDAGFLSFSAANRTVYGTPQIGDEGTYHVNVSVTSDRGKETTYQNYTLSVGSAWAPQIVNGTANVTVQATTVAYRTVTANESVVWTYTDNAGFITFESTNATFRFDPQSHQTGEYHIDLTATSVNGILETTVRINITVTGTWHPTLDPGPQWNGQEAFAYEQTVTANESVIWTYSDNNLPGSLTVSTNDTVLTISGTPTVGDAGEYYIDISAFSVDGKVSHGHNWSFTITAAYGPNISSTPLTTVTIGEEYVYWLTLGEPSDFIFWTDAPFLTWNVSAEKISGTPGPDDVGTYTVNISATATDGGLSEWQNYTLTVNSLWPPVFGYAPSDSIRSIPYSHTFTANESVTWFWHYQIPGEWDVIVGDTTLELQGTPGTPGTYYFNLTATSESGSLSHAENYTFTIFEKIDFLNSPSSAVVNTSYQFTPQFNMPVTIESADTNAPFLTWNGTAFIGDIPINGEGSYWITVVVSSEDGDQQEERNWTLPVAGPSEDEPLATLCASVFFILAMGLVTLPMLMVSRRSKQI